MRLHEETLENMQRHWAQPLIRVKCNILSVFYVALDMDKCRFRIHSPLAYGHFNLHIKVLNENEEIKSR